MKEDVVAKQVNSSIRTGSFFLRMFIFVFFIWLPIQVVVAVILTTQDLGIDSIEMRYFYLILPLLIPILLEWRTRATRRKLGVSIYKDITEELKQLQVDEEVARDVKAREKFEVKDLDYWFDLKQKGAITEQEYEAKKKELL